ncbi:MAG: hypothetical protein IKF97_05775 [Clostridia bacterium]|nr:hypothetical protein [Clostridia bacterium]
MKTFKLKIYETEQDRISGHSDILKSGITDLMEAIKEAKEQFVKEELECIEVVDNNEEKTYFIKDHIEEKIYDNTIFEVYKDIQADANILDLSKKLAHWYEENNTYEFRNNYDSINDAIEETRKVLENEPVTVYNFLREYLLEYNEMGNEFQTCRKLQNEVTDYIINKSINDYSIKTLNEKNVSEFLKLDSPDFEKENTLSLLYQKTFEDLEINNINFIDMKLNADNELSINTEFSSGGTFKTCVTDCLNNDLIIASIREIKEQSVIEGELQEILNYDRKPREISTEEKQEILKGFKKSICNYKLTELPLNRQEAKSNYERKLYEKLQYTTDILKIDFKNVEKEVENFFEKNNIAENFNTLGDIAKINDSFTLTNEATNSQEES